MILLAAWIPENKISLRWTLVLNLLFAEMINAGNNSVSGMFGLIGKLNDGPGCKANGFIGQLSVQAADLSTLAIAVVTFITLRSAADTAKMKRLEGYTTAILFGIWIYPLMTATAGFFWPGYSNVSPNWCWLENNTIARYALTHGPRIIIFTVISVLYSISAVNLLSAASGNGFSQNIKDLEALKEAEAAKRKIYSATVRLMAFPITYLILWAPGMANRCKFLQYKNLVFEALGKQDDLLVFLQSFTQLMGFTDACLSIWQVRAIRK
jgi:hypothetical protein